MSPDRAALALIALGVALIVALVVFVKPEPLPPGCRRVFSHYIPTVVAGKTTLFPVFKVVCEEPR